MDAGLGATRFAHGLLTLESHTEVIYKIFGAEFDSHCEGGLAWNDPTLAVAWPMAPKILSDRDRKWPLFAHFESPFRMNEAAQVTYTHKG